MRSKLDRAGIIAVTASIIAALSSSGVSGAAATTPHQVESSLEVVSQTNLPPVTQALANEAADQTVEQAAPITAASLAGLVAAQPQPADLPRELMCMAGAVYFEAKSESLTGQLAVGRVIVARSKSGRFPNSYCGVVYQPSQFSFVRGGGMPSINRSSRQWRNAVAIAQIAHAGSWRNPVEGALYFHAARVSPSWNRPRIAKLENHIFYR